MLLRIKKCFATGIERLFLFFLMLITGLNLIFLVKKEFQMSWLTHINFTVNKTVIYTQTRILTNYNVYIWRLYAFVCVCADISKVVGIRDKPFHLREATKWIDLNEPKANLITLSYVFLVKLKDIFNMKWSLYFVSRYFTNPQPSLLMILIRFQKILYSWYFLF